MFWKCLYFECKTYLRSGQEWLHFILFLLLVTAFFNIGFLHEIQQGSVKSGALWVALLLASLLTTNDLFRQDATDGTLEQLGRNFMGLEQWFVAKMIGHWLITSFLFVLSSPLLFALLQMEEGASAFSYLLGYWVIMIICAFAACLSLANNAARYILPVIILPITLPVLVFGSGQATGIVQASDSAGIIMIGIAVLLTPICIFGGGAVLRLTVR